MSTAKEALVAELHHNKSVFDRALGEATKAELGGDDQSAAAWAQIAADHAWRDHPGFFASTDLEDLLRRLSVRLKSDTKLGPTDSTKPVLHVLTAAFITGGHTRLVSNWIELDEAHQHDVILTGQRGSTGYEVLRELVQRRGGRLSFLDRSPSGSLLDRALALRAIAADASAVVLHVHPYDVVPALAFLGAQARVPLLVVNHADHVFWVGASLAATFVHIRESGLALSVARRGIERERCIVLPIPVNASRKLPSRDKARRELGMAADDFVVLSVASEYKFRTLGEPTLADILARSAQPHLRYELVGPRSVPSVDDLPRSNVRAWGVQSDTSLFLAAADAFLDSWPFSSLTSALEAGVAGLPIITATWGRAGTVHALDSPGLDDGVVAIQTGAQLVDFLEVFAGDRVAKDVQGKVSSRIIELHSGDGWREVLKTVYAMAGSSASRGETGMQTKDRALGSTHADNVDIMTLNLRYAAGDLSDTSPEGAHGGLLSLRARLRQVWSERSLLTIVPQGTRTLASIALQAMKRRAQALSGSPTVSR